ncbi:hypothetical protein [Microscilla marina]|uniref:Uncharacterized protein n=1 Tax=Microscilla marina ATCC 23134 TaxID=313606 RepID=A1ZMK8_MICM2|nr:hypothetical protein [Microscilla marina]EAY28388.1 hypothetical protein M23134_03940 [Microscilla marina ATCC 23134]
MGATNFERYAFGKTLEEAYRRAYEEAEDFTGMIDGESGDLNSKPGCIEVAIPEGVTPARYLSWIEKADQAFTGYGISQKQKDKLLGSIPDRHQARVFTYANYYADTSAKALAIKMTGRKAQEFRRGTVYAGKPGNVYVFIGCARC